MSIFIRQDWVDFRVNFERWNKQRVKKTFGLRTEYSMGQMTFALISFILQMQSSAYSGMNATLFSKREKVLHISSFPIKPSPSL